jgi:hypothetical protein
MEALLNLDSLIEQLQSSRVQPADARPPDSSGVYAIYLRSGCRIPGMPTDVRGAIYAGSAANLRGRILGTHFVEDRSGSSTLRRSLGALLKEDLDLTALPRNAAESNKQTQHFKFEDEGERRLTEWMKDHLEVGFSPVALDDYKAVEKDLISALEPAINLTGWDNPHRNKIRKLRKVCADEAAAARNPMRLFNLLRLHEPGLDVQQCKVHLAVWNGHDDPLDIYLAGKFEDWQADQHGKNFQRRFVVSLIKTPQPDTWLFAGLYRSNGCRFVKERERYWYDLSRVESCDGIAGRLYVSFRRKGRASYLLAERWANGMNVVEFRGEPLRVAEFPGYSNVLIGKRTLDIIASEVIESWKAALSSVAGVYLISDAKTGKLYVGSATGVGGIWQRWVAYSQTGHGGNRVLRDLLDREGPDYANHFHYSILEIADTHASELDVLERESHWKHVLLSREFGYNGN